MNQRERFLAIAIGGLLGVVVLQWGFNKYKSAKQSRESQIASLQETSGKLNDTLIDGAKAERQMGEYRIRSLPGVPESAIATYQSYLLDLVKKSGLSAAVVQYSASTPNGDLFRRYRFSVSGYADLEKVIDLMHQFYMKDYMHRIAAMDLKPAKTGGLKLDMTVDAVGLNTVSGDVKPPTRESWRVDPSVVAYRDAIMNRNFFEPPNKAPTFSGSSLVRATVGRDSSSKLKFEDPEGHDIRFELAGEAPEFIEFNGDSGTLSLKPEEKGDFEVLVRAIDSGFPSRTTEQLVKINVGDPPPPAKEPEPEPEYDDAKQTVLTGLVEGRDGTRAWLNVRTRGKTLKLRAGDGFEIGTVKGKVVEVTSRFVVMEIDERRVTLAPNDGSLSEAAKRSQED